MMLRLTWVVPRAGVPVELSLNSDCNVTIAVEDALDLASSTDPLGMSFGVFSSDPLGCVVTAAQSLEHSDRAELAYACVEDNANC
eukprot:243429-Rhodomonas_salina.2